MIVLQIGMESCIDHIHTRTLARKHTHTHTLRAPAHKSYVFCLLRATMREASLRPEINGGIWPFDRAYWFRV